MRTMMEIKDPESIQLFADESRRKIIFLLRVKPMTVSLIAEELNLSPQTVYHHIQKLKSAGLVEVVKEERVGHLIESYYQSTAEVFNFTFGKVSSKAESETKFVETILNAANKLGFNLEYNERTAKEIVDVENKINSLVDTQPLLEAISKLDDVDFVTKQKTADLASRLMLSNEKFEERIALERRLQSLYMSMVRPKKK